MDFRGLAYLDDGSPRQRAAAAALRALNLFADLAAYQPVLAGTVPLGIDHPASDLDILCHAPDLAAFAAEVNRRYASQPGFTIKTRVIRGVESVIARFDGPGGFPIELFGQPLPVEQQYGYRHLVIEYRLLQAGGAPVREAIRRLKQAGVRTEPAFAGYFGLEGDPYEALLALEPMDDAQLEKLAKRRLICGLCES